MENGNNRIVLWIVGAFVGLLLMFGFVAATSYVSAYNYGNETEASIKAVYKNNENILAQYSNRIAEMAQVPEAQRDDLLVVYKETMAGRYGKDGSKAVFQWLQEQNPQLNNQLYSRIQVSMEAGRKDFETAQTSLIDQQRAYEVQRGYLWRGFWLRIAGYPKIDLSKYQPISNTYAEGAFKNGKEDGITLRKK